MLARADDFRRSRRWVESKLWSDRAQPQASGSLRQALTEIRTCLGIHRDCLIANRRNIALDPKIIAVNFQSGKQFSSADLFEGLDVRDPEFEAWLTMERQEIRQAELPHSPPISRFSNFLGGNPDNQLTVMFKDADDPVGFAIEHQISQNLTEVSSIRLIGDSGDQTADATLRTNVITEMNRQHLSAQLILANGTIVWTASRNVIGGIEKCVFALSNEASEMILRLLQSRDSTNPAEKLRERALDELFSFDAARLRVADGLFSAAQEYNFDPLVLAWQAFLRMIIINERLENDVQGLREQANELARKALEHGGDNPTLLALVSQVNLFLGIDLDGVEILSRIAAERKPGSALAQMSMSALALRSGKIEEAKHFAESSLTSTGQGRLKHWSHMLNCLAEIATGDFRAATRHAECALALAPSFRPPLRHLYALDVEAGRESRARNSLKKLRSQEPIFSLKMIRDVPEYPAKTLRESSLVKFRDVDES